MCLITQASPPNRLATMNSDPTAEPLVTCVIPTHGRQVLVGEALASVASQHLRPDAVVVVDDCGDFATQSASERILGGVGPELRYVDASDSSNSSAGRSRNVGAQVAGSRWLAFLDDDDLWDPDFLSATLARADESGAPLIVTWLDYIQTDGRVSEGRRILEGLTYEQVLSFNPGITGSNFLIRRDTFEAIGGFDPDLWVANDLDFFVRYLAAGYEYAVVPRPLALHRHHIGTRLTSGSARRVEGLARYWTKYATDLQWHDRLYLRSLKITAVPRRSVLSWTIRRALSFLMREFAGIARRRRSGRSAPTTATRDLPNSTEGSQRGRAT